MSTKTAAQTLRADLDASLPSGIVWTKLELVTLARVEVMADRLAALIKLTDAAIADPDASASRITMLANSCRQLEVSMHGLIKTLDPTMETAKSMKHVAGREQEMARQWVNQPTPMPTRNYATTSSPRMPICARRSPAHCSTIGLRMVVRCGKSGLPLLMLCWEGRAVEISRYELPDWHSESPKYGGDPGNRFVLDVDDVLRPAPESPRVLPNRAQRRAMGQRGYGLNGNGR